MEEKRKLIAVLVVRKQKHHEILSERMRRETIWGSVHWKITCCLSKKEKKRKTTQAAKSSSHQLRKRGHVGRKALHQKRKGGVCEDKEGCGQTSQQTSPDWFQTTFKLKVRRMLKRTSGLNKLMSIVHRMSMKLESKFLDSL